ncbi:MAG TPA: hypothetical protein VM324_07415 [Egibacteraceae bacterium]|jgi:hypothetical protein|nr:hypothetical protein [Egibacteraceae bacterium]
MNLTAIHGYMLGFAVIGSWLIIGFWALALRFTRYEETPTFWRAVSIAQLLLVAQVIVGVVLLVLGRMPGPEGGMGTLLFHLSYGLFSPLVVLVVAHAWARSGRFDPHAIFAFVGLVNFGLMVRAWQVGVWGA